MFFILPQSGRQTLKFIKNKNAFPLKSTKAFMKTLIDDLRKEAEKMRKKLKQLGNQKRHTFIGRFERVGYKKRYRYYQPMLLLTQVALSETGELITDHLWLNYTKGFLALGDLLQFDGRVASYVKGYFGTQQKLDYKVERPSQVVLLAKIEGPRRLLPDTATKMGRQALIGYIMERERVFYEASCCPIDPYYVDQYQIWLTNHVMKTNQNYDLVARKSLTSHLKNAEPH